MTGTTAIDCNDKQVQPHVVLLNAFYSGRVSSTEASLSKLTANSAVMAVDYQVVVARHVTTKEITNSMSFQAASDQGRLNPRTDRSERGVRKHLHRNFLHKTSDIPPRHGPGPADQPPAAGSTRVIRMPILPGLGPAKLRADPGNFGIHHVAKRTIFSAQHQYTSFAKVDLFTVHVIYRKKRDHGKRAGKRFQRPCCCVKACFSALPGQ
jgi:hypothetical protein